MTRRGEEGFTLLELVFAMVLLSIGIAALIGVLATSFRSVAVDVHRTDATAIASQGLAELAADPTSGALPPVTRNGQTYTLTGTAAQETASDGVGTYPEVSVTVAWTDAAGPHTLTRSTARYSSPPTTATGCSALGPVNPVENAPGGDPSIDVSWQEPVGGGPAGVTRWEVQVSPDGSTWTTAIADEPPLPVGSTHQLELGGLAGTTAYQVQVVAVPACGGTPQTFAASGATTPPPASSGCAPGSMTLGPAVADRVSSGAAAGMLTSDVTVVVTSPGACAAGLSVSADTGEGVVTATLSAVGTYSYTGTLPGLAQGWSLGVHDVQAFAGATPVGTPVATGVLCVEAEGAGTC
jgi:prepilin-type N-terminal cleavage/methylation domain-containing protein